MTSPNPDLSLNQKGKDVALLQSRLMTLGYTIVTSEILNEVFGQSTFQAVILFQRREGLPPTGGVDAATAQTLIKKFESERTTTTFSRPQPEPPQTPPTTQPPAQSAAAPQASTPASMPSTPAPSSSQPPAQASAPPTDQASGTPPPPLTPGPPPATEPPPTTYSLQGALRFDYGLPASGVTVRLYNVGFAGQDVQLGATTADAQGHYSFSYKVPPQQSPNVQVRVVDCQATGSAHFRHALSCLHAGSLESGGSWQRPAPGSGISTALR